MYYNLPQTTTPKVSYYYKYDFVSPEIIYSEIKEELRSYFQTGVVDDILFPRYTEDCLKDLGRTSYKINETILQLDNYTSKLPDNFKAIRELWLITPHEVNYRMPNSTYEQSTCLISSTRDRCDPCENCAPQEIKLTYKTTGTLIQNFTCHHLLKPGNIHAVECSSFDNINIYSGAIETYDVRDGKLITNFPEGFLYMVYYSIEYDKNDFQLIPDNIYIKRYLKAYLKYKCFETIYNNVSDETFKQVESKFIYYKREADEAKVIAETELKKQTLEQQIRATKRARKRFNKYIIT
jgi:hypothetical protein